MSPSDRRRTAPALTVSVASDGARAALSLERVEAIARRALRAEGITRGELSITFVSKRAIAKLNREHLDHEGPTDIITFEMASGVKGFVLADVYISPDVARGQAAEHGSGVREETARLVVHGVLHAVGYTHPEGEERTASPMWKRQEALVRAVRRAGELP